MALTLTPKTTIATLLKEYPFLLDYLAGYHPDFKKLTNPVLRRTMGRLATIEQAAAMAGVDRQKLLDDIAGEIEKKTGGRPNTASLAAAGVDPARQEELKDIIRELHSGRTPEEVKPRFEELIQGVEASEIAAMEQALIAGGMPDTEVKRLCDVHMQVFQDALEANPALCLPPGHPIDTFQRENVELLKITAELRRAAERAGRPPEFHGWTGTKEALATLAARLSEVERHYLRKENQLFPFLEKHGVEGPTKVMWALHDDIRAVLKELRRAIAADSPSATVHAVDEATTMVDDMVNKEERVLFPMAMDVLPEQEWRAIRAGEEEIGYAYVEEVPDWPPAEDEVRERAEAETSPAEEEVRETTGAAAGAAAAPGPEIAKVTKYSGPMSEAAGAAAQPAESAATAAPTAIPGSPAAGALMVSTGALTLDQLNLLLRRIPVDMTFVDEHDEVRFYSEGERVFPRSPGVIGRKVQNCHPPASVHKVQEIVKAFRAGEKDVAEFWIELGEKFVHIRYFALRDQDGTYRGVLETVQDVTGIRALQGERRLLDW